jgi:DNA-binding NtrC family response regulator
MSLKILVVDDDKNSREIIQMFLSKYYTVDVAINGVHALEMIKSHDYDVIICDFVMNDVDGMDVLREMNKMNKGAYFVLITAFGTGDIAVKAIQEGAYEYLSKPFKMSKLKDILNKLANRTDIKEQKQKNNKERGDSGHSILNTNSEIFLEILKNMARIAQTDVPVLITGESGTGKEVMAKSIHEYSKRKNKSFVAVNCNAIPATLLESELFGYEKGAFTGADKPKKGYFEQAQHGTLFLDEIGDLDMELQVKLLRVLQENQVRRIGGTKDINLNVRFIFATNVDLDEKLKEKKFRSDLYYRLKVTELHLPPLRERKEDIIPIAEFFIQKYSSTDESIVLSDKAKKILMKYDYPGNIRELENIIRSAIILARDTGIIMPHDLDINLSDKGYTKFKNNLTRDEIISAIRECGGNKKAAAEKLNMSRATLYRLINKYSIKDV